MERLDADVAGPEARCRSMLVGSNLPSAIRFAVKRNALTMFVAEQVSAPESERLGHAVRRQTRSSVLAIVSGL